MNTLTLVPINDVWINPEEIAAISPDWHIQKRAVITLKNNQIAVIIKDMTVDEVVQRLQKHFNPAT